MLDGYRGELSWLERARILSPLGPPSDPRAHRDGLREALDEARETLRHAVAQSESVTRVLQGARPRRPCFLHPDQLYRTLLGPLLAPGGAGLR